ncbi:MAG: alpha-glucosidase [Promethearchaeota archaeon]
MITYSITDRGFDLFFKDYKFFSHSINNPCFEIGIGSGNFKQKHSIFTIKEKKLERFPLSKFKLLSELDNQVIIEFSDKDNNMVVEFYVKDDKLLITPKCENSSINRFWMTMNASEEEAIFGCGEQFLNLNSRGKTIPIWVEDASPLSRGEHTYYPQPNFISTKKYFCHIETSFYSKFNFENKITHKFEVWDIPSEICIGKYDNLLDTVKNLNFFLGLQPKPADWIYDGIWLGIQGGTEIVDKKIKKALQHDVKVSAVWCQDWQGIRFTSFGKQLFWDWKYDDKIYPNLPEYIKRLNNQGIKFLGYINTMLAIEGDLYKEASKKGYCLKNKDGEDYLVMMTDFPAAQTDLSNPEAVDWLKSVIKKHMLGIGLNGWMVDYGEYLPIDPKLFSGISGEEFHNQVPTIWTKLNYEILEEEDLLDEVIFFTRSGFTGTSKYSLLFFSGDQRVDWDEKVGLPSVIPGAINIGLTGIGYYHFDIGCYTTYGDFKRDKELFMRSAEMAVFSMMMRTHEGNRPDDNWQFDSDSETLDHLANMVDIHLALKPYLRHLSDEYYESGLPPIRGLFLHYENDPESYKIKFQYLFGKDLLIAPVIKPNCNIWKVYLPKDNWIHFWTGKEFSGGWIEIESPIGSPPVFYRRDSEYRVLFESISKF